MHVLKKFDEEDQLQTLMAFMTCGSMLTPLCGRLYVDLIQKPNIPIRIVTSRLCISNQMNCLSASHSNGFLHNLYLISHARRSQMSHNGWGAQVTARAERDYYSILGMSRTSSKSDIKRAYRKLARSHHPDVNKEEGAEQKFKEISNAYEVLSDDAKRALYDKYGEAGLKGGGGIGMGDFRDPFDLFESLFNGMGRKTSWNGVLDGEDEYYNLVLTFKEAVFGVEKEIKASRLENCGTCHGSGAKPGSEPTTCRTCNGRGQVMASARTPLGVFQQVSLCSMCDGTGKIHAPCGMCAGDGRARRMKHISLKVPAGVDSGSCLRVRLEGNVGMRGGSPGDLLVNIQVTPDPILKRSDASVLYTCRVSYVDAILGTTIKVPTVDGVVDLKIPAGTQPNTTLVMVKKGVPLLNKSGARGDQLVRVQVEIPKKLGNQERMLIEELAVLNKDNTTNSRTR